jgi:MerR family transcriptional regulator, redox-sensitive transcriptional activator SoxR
MKLQTIGEVAKRTGVAASALRYYERAGILPAPHRAGGRRLYDADALRRVDVLPIAQQAGFTLGEIKTLFNGFGSSVPLSERWQSLARAKIGELDLLAKRIRKMKGALELGLACGCVRIEDCSLSPRDIDAGKSRTSCCG